MRIIRKIHCVALRLSFRSWKLPEPMVRNASLEAGDWLTHVRPLIADVSTKAIQWWDNVVEGAFKQYRLWLAASPLDRLKIPAPSEQELSKGFF